MNINIDKKEFTFAEGNMADCETNTTDIKIIVGATLQRSIGCQPCRHCIDNKDGSFIVTRSVWANDGSHHATGVCIDCILEAMQEVGKYNLTKG